MNLVFFNSEDCVLKEGDYVFCKSEDKELLEIWIEDNNFSPEKMFYVVPSGSDYLELVGAYIWIKECPQANYDDEYASRLNNIISALNNKEVVSPNLQKLIASSKSNNEFSKELSEKILKIAHIHNRISESLFLSNQLFGVVSDNKPLDWWDKLHGLQDVLDGLVVEFEGYNDAIFLAYTNLLSNLKRRISKRFPSQPEKNFLFLSAYCFTSADYHLRSQNYLSCFLMVHRSLDYFFQFFCIKNGLLGITTSGLEYFDKSEMVGLFNSYKRIKRSGVMNLSPRTKNDIEWINSRRNNLISTHGIQGCDSAICNASMRKAESLINNAFSAHAPAWNDAYDSFKFESDIKLDSLMTEVLDFESQYLILEV